MSTNSSTFFPVKLGALAERDFFPSNCRKALAFALLHTNGVTCPDPASHCGLASHLQYPLPTLQPGQILTLHYTVTGSEVRWGKAGSRK